jgi:hypothetical protein
MDTPARLATPADVDALAARLLSDDTLQLGQCRLIRNTVCDCVLGTDPFGIECVAAYTSCERGCREAILWAARANRVTPSKAA